MRLFREVSCQGYLQRIWDGKFIEKHDCEEEEVLLKTYYKYREKSFKGFVVGTKDIVATGNLIAHSVCAPFDDHTYRIEKKPLEVVKCAIVYFGNNRKRFVPLDKILEVEW